MYRVQFKTDSTRSVAFYFFIYSLIHSSKHKRCTATEQMQSSLRSACTTLFGDPYALRSIDSSEGMLMNKGQPCILGNKDVDNGKEEENAIRKHIHLRANSIFILDTHTSICSVGYKFLSLTFFFRKLKVGCLGLLVMAG